MTSKPVEGDENPQRIFAEALSEIAILLTSTLDLNTVLQRILENVGRVVQHDSANIMFIEGDSLRVVARSGEPDVATPALSSLSYREIPHLMQMVTDSAPVVIPNTAAYPGWIRKTQTAWVASYVAAPVAAHDRIIGFLNLNSGTPGFYTKTDAARLQAFASQTAVALENAQLYAQVVEHRDRLETQVRTRTTDLVRARDRVEAILNHSSDAILLAHTDSAIQQANLTFNTMFGYEPDEVYGAPLHVLVDRHSEPVFQQALEQVVSTGHTAHIEVIAQHKDLSPFDVEMGLSLVTPESPTSIVCSIRDITERKQAERALRDALQQEKELNELKTQFIAMVSHEFRTPLAIIQSSSDSLKLYRQRMDAEQIALRLENIQHQVQRLSEMLDNVLTMGRSQSGQMRFQPETMDMYALCQDLLHEFHEMSGIHHDLRYKGIDYPLELWGDPHLLRRVIMNLISNAIKYSEPGTPITLSLSNDEPNTLLLCIADQGIGISDYDQKYIFDVFFRSETVAHITGTGLGLSIAKQAVEMHGGTISFESREGEGTTFMVTLPLPDRGHYDSNPRD